MVSFLFFSLSLILFQRVMGKMKMENPNFEVTNKRRRVSLSLFSHLHVDILTLFFPLFLFVFFFLYIRTMRGTVMAFWDFVFFLFIYFIFLIMPFDNF